MYVVVHCALLDERIFSEEEAKLQAVFALDVKDVQLLLEVTVFGFEREYHCTVLFSRCCSCCEWCVRLRV